MMDTKTKHTMKIFKHAFSISLLLLAVYSCSKDDELIDINTIAAPTNVSAAVTVTQDNTGLVTITPLGEGVTNFKIAFGDNSEPSDILQPGKSVTHIYEEGTYNATITANGLNGLSTSATQEIAVSFKAPQNLMVTIENDGTISKTVKVMATADFALSYNVDFGDGSDPVMSNINDTTTYTYQDAGTYTIVVTAFSAAIETASYTEEFEVTAILQPLQAAPAQPNRAPEDVISIYSDRYENIAGSDYYPNWGQSTTFNQLAINGNNMIQYGNLNYQGIQFGATANASQMEFLHIDVWTADDNLALDIFPISIATGEKFVQKIPVAGQWNSYNIPLSDFTSQGLSLEDLHQFKFVGTPAGGTVFLDNIYFYRAASTPFNLAGTWKMEEAAGSLGVGPSVGDISWFNCDAACVAARACYFDDLYIFGSDGSFNNDLGSESWIEPWQGGGDACGAPVPPYDGSNPAIYTVDQANGTFTLNGTGAYIGLAKANNQGELPNVGVPNSITYNFSAIDPNTISVYVEAGTGVFWQYRLVRTSAPVSPLAGIWKMSETAGSLGVGPTVGDISWFNCDAGCIATRACYFDDTYVFGSDGSFTNNLGTESWIEGWQGGGDACGTPVAPYDGNATATYSYDAAAGSLTLNGKGAYLGIPKANNLGELPNVAVPDAITYNVTMVDANNMDVYIESGAGVFWQFKLERL